MSEIFSRIPAIPAMIGGTSLKAAMVGTTNEHDLSSPIISQRLSYNSRPICFRPELLP